jgi:hypothetical protein
MQTETMTDVIRVIPGMPILKGDCAPQDLSYYNDRHKAISERWHTHPGKNTDYPFASRNRYKPHIGQNVRYTKDFKRVKV